LNRSEPNVIFTAHATKVNRIEPNWTEPQTCLACQNQAFSVNILARGAWIPCSQRIHGFRGFRYLAEQLSNFQTSPWLSPL